MVSVKLGVFGATHIGGQQFSLLVSNWVRGELSLNPFIIFSRSSSTGLMF
jgi:hypothetical protein